MGRWIGFWHGNLGVWGRLFSLLHLIELARLDLFLAGLRSAKRIAFPALSFATSTHQRSH